MLQVLLSKLTGMPAAPKLQRNVAPYKLQMLKGFKLALLDLSSPTAAQPSSLVAAALLQVGATVQQLPAITAKAPPQAAGEVATNKPPPATKMALEAVVVDLLGSATTPELLSQLSSQLTNRVLSNLLPCASILILARDDCDKHVAGHMGLAAFIRSLAKELGAKGARINLLIVKNTAAASQQSGDAANLSSAMSFFLTKKSAFVTGQTLLLSLGERPPPAIATDASATNPVAPLYAGKLVLVTGAARGIGKAVADGFAAEGATVIRVDRDKILNDPNAIAADLGTAEGRQLIASTVAAKYAGKAVDVMVHNAGITRDKTLAKMSERDWADVMRINMSSIKELNAAVNWAEDGTAVLMSSVSGLAGNFGQTNYAAAKGVLMGWARSDADFFLGSSSSSGNRRKLVCIAPGFIISDMTAKMPFMMRTIAARSCSLLQGGLPVDVANAVVFFSSPAGSAGFAGECVRVCGGNVVGADTAYLYRSHL